MGELCLMASHGYPPGLGVGFHQEHAPSREFNHFPNCHGLKQDLVDPLSFNLSGQQKEDWRSLGGFLDSNNCFRFDPTCRRPAVIDFQDTSPDSAVFGFGVVERCARHEKILKLLMSGSIEEEDPLLSLSMLYDLAGPQSLIADLPQQPFVSHFKQSDGQSMQNLVYPIKELYLREPFLDFEDRSSSPEKAYHPNAQLPYSYTTTEMVDMLSVLSDIQSLKNTNKSSRQTMLVPYFERRRKASTRTDASKLATEKVGSLKMQEKVKEKTPRRKKTMSSRSGNERGAYSNSYLHACESLLSVIMDRKQQQGKNAFVSLKKSGPQLPRLLTQFSASIAGAGIAVVLSVLCRVACNRVPFCASKLLSTGLGLGLICLSWAVNRLRDTVVSITKTSGKSKKEQEMMIHLDRNLKDIYLSAAALVAVVVLKAA